MMMSYAVMAIPSWWAMLQAGPSHHDANGCAAAGGRLRCRLSPHDDGVRAARAGCDYSLCRLDLHPPAPCAPPPPHHPAARAERTSLPRGAMWVRRGLATTTSTVECTVPVEFVTSTGGVTLVADPVAGRRSWTTTLPAVMPGDEFELVVESFLQYSLLVVR